MSDFTDDAVRRYLGQNAGLRKEYALDPATHHRVELMRQILDATERAMATEGVPPEARQRVVNRVVWGEPEGLVDVHTRAREQTLAVLDQPINLAEVQAAIDALIVPPVRPGEETTP